jgi:hypothetical protein
VSAPPDRHYDRSARSSLDEEARVAGKARVYSSSPGSAAAELKTPQWSADRRRAPRQVRAHELPKRRVGAPPPSLEGREERTKGGPAPSSIGRRSVGLRYLFEAGLFDIVAILRDAPPGAAPQDKGIEGDRWRPPAYAFLKRAGVSLVLLADREDVRAHCCGGTRAVAA